MRKIAYCCLTILLLCCKDKYDAPVKVPITGYLVVEGYISAEGPVEIHLSRSIPLSDTTKLINETLAKVQLQGRDNSMFNLTETPGGNYINTRVNLNHSQQYRLYIKSGDGKEYASDYVSVKNAPSIDSVGFVRENGGVQLYVNTHDPYNNTWYYRWTTEETWEYHSSYYTALEFLYDSVKGYPIGVKWRRPDQKYVDSLFTCWSDQNSTNLILGSSAKLSLDSIHKPLTYIEPASFKLSVLYSLLVKQYALGKEEYEYLDKMKKNSEETGNIFGRQPSELKGNIHCLSNANEPVIGYIGIANRMEKRFWIDRWRDVPDWQYYLPCDIMGIPVSDINEYSNFMPTTPRDISPTGDIISYVGVTPNCVDCTLRGGKTKKPSFWP
ncbi:hypothetical protein A4H97_03195 [Niastella yeongjuensis]|uniref:DUF4249 domain-containing protein n=1 Tax=Niastella yeongjuensis TaxID=354355 RepID=A0A1V9EXK1_9BACT|nr:DUF4249 domain-containing protein [Niastella yeongjuensis]OQP50846.1 hypothetical protein A4H97_03195 [Niastella yeongjuensis]SEN15005.1 protein of unknown function [Niastella yeongjuensis]